MPPLLLFRPRLDRRCRFFSSSPIQTLVLSNLFPDSSASAAGVRTQSLLGGLAQFSGVHIATAVSNALPKQTESLVAAKAADIIEELASQNISWSHLPPNRSHRTQDFCREHPKIATILFDRFYTEEAYSFVLKEHYPDAALALDMQDMHSLRRGRETIVKEWDSRHTGDPLGVLDQVMAHIPSVNDPMLLRELASIHRCDLTLVCSPYELFLLQSIYKISSSKLCLAPFFVPSDQIRKPNSNESRSSFVFCGGFKHAPNVDAVRILLRLIWPRIRQALPTATLHIHGAYCPVEFHNAHSPSQNGIHVHGYAPSLEQVFDRDGSILLAPLRFGAGIKGKIIDAWTHGIPVVTTPVGSEGLVGHSNEESSSFGGSIALTVDEFVEMAIELSVSADAYDQATRRGQEILRKSQDRTANWDLVKSAFMQTTMHIHERRRNDFTRAMLWHQSARSTEYFSRWVELKESLPVTRRE